MEMPDHREFVAVKGKWVSKRTQARQSTMAFPGMNVFLSFLESRKQVRLWAIYICRFLKNPIPHKYKWYIKESFVVYFLKI